MGVAAEPPRNSGLSPTAAAAVHSAAWWTSAAAAEPAWVHRLAVSGHDADGAPRARPAATAQGPASRVPEVLLLRQVREHGLQVSVSLDLDIRSRAPRLRRSSHRLKLAWLSSLANCRNGDPSRPCNSDWKKYGKQFSGALAHSYSIAPKPGTNGTTSAATNFQRPLPQRQAAAPPPQQHYGGGGYGGGYGGGGYGGGFQPQFRPAFGPPPGALVLQPGDPRIGGQ